MGRSRGRGNRMCCSVWAIKVRRYCCKSREARHSGGAQYLARLLSQRLGQGEGCRLLGLGTGVEHDVARARRERAGNHRGRFLLSRAHRAVRPSRLAGGPRNNSDKREFLAFYWEATQDEKTGTGRLSFATRRDLIDAALEHYYRLSARRPSYSRSALMSTAGTATPRRPRRPAAKAPL
jgi:hypothetical protein